jgi:hypothetical protein
VIHEWAGGPHINFSASSIVQLQTSLEGAPFIRVFCE